MSYGSEKSFSSVSEGSGYVPPGSVSDSGSSSGSASDLCEYVVADILLVDAYTGSFTVRNEGLVTLDILTIGFPTGGTISPPTATILVGQEVTFTITSDLEVGGSVVYLYTSCGDSSFTFPAP